MAVASHNHAEILPISSSEQITNKPKIFTPPGKVIPVTPDIQEKISIPIPEPKIAKEDTKQPIASYCILH